MWSNQQETAVGHMLGDFYGKDSAQKKLCY